MNPDFRKVALIAAVLGLLVSLFVALRPDDEDDAAPTIVTTTTAPTTTARATLPAPSVQERPVLQIRIEGGAPVGGIQRATVEQGSTVSIRIRSETTSVLHVHGYDITFGIQPNEAQEVFFKAEHAGVFEIELEDTHTVVAELTVEP